MRIETHSVWLNKNSFTKTWHTDDTALTAEGLLIDHVQRIEKKHMEDIRDLDDIK